MTDRPDKPESPADFERLASGERIGLVAEFWEFICHNKKWWLVPIMVVLLLFGVLILAAGGGAAPWIYTLF